MDRDKFLADVEDALAHLYDLTYLSDDALARSFSIDVDSMSADRLHRLLVDAVGTLRPPLGSPATSASWRRYRYLAQRYLAGQSHKTVASELGLSVRQAHRTRAEAVDAV